MIKIRITAPFRYQYITKQEKKEFHFIAGDYYHLDPVKNKEEAKTVLSSNFPFKHFIHVELETVPASLKKEMGIEAGNYEEYTLPIEEEFFVYTQTDENGDFVKAQEQDELPAQEPTPNKFDLTTQEAAKVEEAKVVKQDDLGIVDEPANSLVEKTYEETKDLEVGGEKKREERKAELEDLHYSKVKEVAELYNLEYTTKKETISEILNLEYGGDSEPTDIPV